MKKHLLVFTFFFYVFGFAFAQNSLVKQWDYRYGGTDIDWLTCFQQTSDKGYILGGPSYSGISGDKTQAAWGNREYWIVKTDSLGIKQWDRDFGGTDEDQLYSLQQTVDGGYILGGTSSSGISGDKTQSSWGREDYWIIKIDSLGNKQWDKDFGGTDIDRFHSIQQTADRGYILSGYSYSGISGDKTQPTWGEYDYWIVKVDSFGNKQWDKNFGGTGLEEYGKVLQTTDGGYLISGDSYSPMSGDKTESNLGTEQTWIIKTDSFGNKQWDKTIFTDGYDAQGLSIQTQDGCYAIVNLSDGEIAGYKTQTSQGLYDYWLIKFCDSTLVNPESVNDFASNTSQLSISPNPFQNKITIHFPAATAAATATATIYNTLGEVVYRITLSGVEGQHSKFNIDLSFLSQGIYFLSVQAGDEVYRGKMVRE